MPYQKQLQSAVASECGIGLWEALQLVLAGYDDLEKLGAASDGELLAVPGIGPDEVGKIRAAVEGGA